MQNMFDLTGMFILFNVFCSLLSKSCHYFFKYFIFFVKF